MALAMQDAEQLKPLLSRLAQISTALEIEATGLQQLELRPLALVPDTDETNEGKTAEELEAEFEERREKVIAGVKKQMKATFEDLQLKSNPETAKVWNAAVNNARAREEESNEVEKVKEQNEIEDEAEEENLEPEEDPARTQEPFESVPSPPNSPPSRSAELPVVATKETPEEENRLAKKDHQEKKSFAHLPSPPPESELNSK
jgi:hypothetical protein